MGLVLVEPPATEPVTLEEAKNYLRVDVSEDDELIANLIRAAREYVEVTTGRALVTQVWDLVLDGWPRGNIVRIPRLPLQDVLDITYKDKVAQAYTLPQQSYVVNAAEGYVLLDPTNWVVSALLHSPLSQLIVRFRAGYDDPARIPQPLKLAMLFLIAHWYENREATAEVTRREMPWGVEALLVPYRVHWF